MLVNLYSFDKKKNSTKQPTITDATTLTSVQLKDATSIVNPVLLINPSDSALPTPFVPSGFNYVHIPSFGRYYYVTDWNWINGIWECYLTVDVLASFKTSIGNMSAYVERSSYTYNTSIIDKLYPAKTDVQITSATIATSWANVAPSGGCYVLGLINYQPANHIGAVSYYAMTSANLNSLLAYLFSNNIFNAGSITEIGEDLFKSLFNPFQYVVSCMWFPASPSTYGSTQTTVKVGYWDTGVVAYSVDALVDVRFITGTIPAHPQAATRGEYLNYAPYTRITLFCPPFGEIPIDASFTRTGMYLYSKVAIDTITGQATLRVAFRQQQSFPYSAKPCIEKTCMMGVPIQLAQVLSDYSGAINTLTGSFSGGSVGVAGGLIAATVDSAIAAYAPKVSSNGANGSFVNFALEPNLVVEHMLLVDEDNADLGRPLMEKRTLNTIPGYIKCAESHFSGACFDSEKDSINTFLVNGFFYE